MSVSEGGQSRVDLCEYSCKGDIDLPWFTLYPVFFHARNEQIVGVFNCILDSKDGSHSILY